MKIKIIIIVLALCTLTAFAQSNEVIQDMAIAFKKNDAKTLARLLPRTKGHPLESWAAYWELKARLPQASPSDVDTFFKRYANTYAEDRLRADWLLLLGQNQDWRGFSAYYPAYRMKDDKDIACYANQDNAALVQQHWMAQKEQRTGCGWVASQLIDAGKMDALVAWRKQFNAKTALPFLPTAAQQDWALGFEGRALAQKLDLAALDVFAKVIHPANLSDDMLSWWTRAALRKQDWMLVQRLINSMSLDGQKYWAQWKDGRLRSDDAPLALQVTPPRGVLNPAALPGLTRALYAIQMGLRSEGVREWNYEVNLARGSMSDAERFAAADLACQAEVWDRCINTSERTKESIDWSQRYPTPYRAAIVAAAKDQGLDPAFVFGLIRQESRFIADARSSVGAAGLMQLMPATARWTAKRIGMSDFSQNQVTDAAINTALGAAYLKYVLDEFGGNAALAAAAYNAGPHRVKSWLQLMPLNSLANPTPLELAIWIENIPFNETRDYAKRVAENTKVYKFLLK